MVETASHFRPERHLHHLTVNDHEVEFYEGLGSEYAQSLDRQGTELIVVPPEPHIYTSKVVIQEQDSEGRVVNERDLGPRRVLVTHGWFAPIDFMAKNQPWHWIMGDKDSTKIVDFVNAYNDGPGKNQPIEVLYICDCPQDLTQQPKFNLPVIHGAGSEVSGSITRFPSGQIETLLRLTKPDEGRWIGLDQTAK